MSKDRIAMLHKQIAELEARMREEQNQRDKARNQAFDLVIANDDNFEWRAIPTTHKQWLGDKGPGKPGIRMTKRLRPDIVERLKEHWDTTPHHWCDWEGMFYYRTEEGILDHEGGGTHVLATPKLCSDHEWMQLETGIIPDKFKWRSTMT